MKYLITGISAAGKTTMAVLLRKQGHTTYDGDRISGLGHWVDSSAKPVKVPPRLTVDWMRRHYWNWEQEQVDRLLKSDATVFICGTSSNIKDFYPLFDKVFFLSISQETLKKRLDSRSSGFGKFKQEKVMALEWHDWFEGHHKALATTVIDANLPKQIVLKQILDQLA
ncbi:MAG: hypothetical protein JWO96_45 [Candidatus Saccharibacteria bacterium]|nr:hypothetical protein [Candidatus Saccharibacteria bacterium]